MVAGLQDREIVATVSDNGIGIPAEMLPTVFDMFAQVDRTLERSQAGLRVGLTLARHLTELHNGTITAYSDGRGRGSRFVVRLPVLEEPGRNERGSEADVAHAATDGSVIVAITGWGQEDDKRRAREAGFDHHMVKPVEPAAIQSILTNHHAKRQK